MFKLATRIMLALVLIILFASVVLSAHDIIVTLTDSSQDFSVYAPQSTIAVCQCSTTASSVVITNTGSFGAKYFLEANQEYVLMGKSSITLSPGESKTIPVYINAPCTKKASDTLVITVSSVYGNVKEIEQNIVFSDCQNLQVTIPQTTIAAGVCEPFTTSFTLANIGDFSETYHVRLGTFAEHATLSANKITLPPQALTTVDVAYSLPCDVYGEYVLEYFVEAEKNNHEALFSQELFIDQSYNFSLRAEPVTSVCEEESAGYSLFLRNHNNFKDVYDISFDAPAFVDIVLVKPQNETLDAVSVMPGEARELEVRLTPQIKKSLGNHSITIKATSLNGDVTELFSTTLDVLDCYNFNNHLQIPYKEIRVCGFDSQVRPFQVQHKGTAQAGVELVLTAPNFILLEDNFLTLPPHSQTSTNLLFSDVRNISETYPVTVESYFRGEVVDSETFDVHVQPAQECYQAGPQQQEFKIRYVKDTVSLTLTNDGTRYGWYELELVGNEFLFVDPSLIDLGQSESKQTQLLIDKEQLKIALDNQNASLIDYSLSATLHVTHLDSGLVFAYPITITFVDYPLTTRVWNFLQAQNPCTLVFATLLIMLAALIILLVVRLAQKALFRSNKTLGVILLGLVLLAGIVTFLVYGIPQYSDWYTQHDLTTNTTTYLRLAEDRPMKYNLQEFFFDPDDDIESYAVDVLNTDVLSYKLRGSTLKLIPARDWSGATIVRFSATDSYGEVAQSPDIFVEVLPVEDYSLKEFFAKTCVYINLLLIVLVAGLLFVTFSLRERKAERARRKEIKKQKVQAAKQRRAEERAKKKAEREAKKQQAAKQRQATKKKTATKKAVKKTASKKRK